MRWTLIVFKKCITQYIQKKKYIDLKSELNLKNALV